MKNNTETTQVKDCKKQVLVTNGKVLLNEVKGFYAGSYDCFTLGHYWTIIEALKFCDSLVVGMGTNPEKERRFPVGVMLTAIKNVFKNNPRITVIAYDGLTYEAAHKYGATFLIRGVRNATDLVQEQEMANFNRVNGNIDTFFIPSNEKVNSISSTLVYNLFKHGQDVSSYVPDAILKAIKRFR